MIATDKRKAIYLLHQEGMSAREIARRFKLGRNTVHRVIEQQGQPVTVQRRDKQPLDPDRLRQLYQDCEGRVQRMYEKLVEEEGIPVKYSTLTRKVRALGLGQPPQLRCHHVPDEPGQEMQHDTTVYTLELGERRVKLVASLIYLRYAKRRYLKFYRHFNRFQMKCFFHQALTHWGYAARQCIIDNTNLARLRGIGQHAVMVPEMAAFARQYGFEFRCHERGHSNRKAGEERSFWTVETNFLPGRTFASLEDLNAQAFAWATERMEQRPQTKAGIIPAQAFEHERAFLVELPPHWPAPYQVHERGTDQYGYITFDANFYWVPGTDRAQLLVLQYADTLKIYKDRECLAEYALPPDGTRNQRFSPPGLPLPPHHPHNRRHPTQEEEKRLRALGPPVSAYLDWVLARKGPGRHRFLRSLLALSRKMSPELFRQSVERAARFQIEQIDTLERIAGLYLQQGTGLLPVADVDEQFTQRAAYLEGALTEAPDLSVYEDPPQDDPPPADSPHE
jgi:transposase